MAKIAIRHGDWVVVMAEKLSYWKMLATKNLRAYAQRKFTIIRILHP
jgi:hypothetical protein